MTAKQRLAKVRRNTQRGNKDSSSTAPAKKDPKDIAAEKAKSHCADGRGWGHWHGDPECPKVKSGAVPR